MYCNAGPNSEVFRIQVNQPPSVVFTTLGPFGGGRVSLAAWPKVRKDLESAVSRFRICSYFAELEGSLL